MSLGANKRLAALQRNALAFIQSEGLLRRLSALLMSALVRSTMSYLAVFGVVVVALMFAISTGEVVADKLDGDDWEAFLLLLTNLHGLAIFAASGVAILSAAADVLSPRASHRVDLFDRFGAVSSVGTIGPRNTGKSDA
ncbi:hypothetical protein [Achromobacter insuavis]|uniref:hypothetical protein n=1 Tax=Achromobacter insuavis TaxID=1287735 RepID=UPI001F12E9E8|nr:hypothetical protein [Achromobacter insuavis]